MSDLMVIWILQAFADYESINHYYLVGIDKSELKIDWI